jgi:hypothetical protein
LAVVNLVVCLLGQEEGSADGAGEVTELGGLDGGPLEAAADTREPSEQRRSEQLEVDGAPAAEHDDVGAEQGEEVGETFGDRGAVRREDGERLGVAATRSVRERGQVEAEAGGRGLEGGARGAALPARTASAGAGGIS